MMLSSVGTEIRRSVLVVLHDASHPWITMARDWKTDRRLSKVNGIAILFVATTMRAHLHIG